MKYVLLASTILAGFVTQAQALTITTSQILPSLGSIIAPSPAASTNFGTFTTSQTSGGTITALSPFQIATNGVITGSVSQGSVDYGSAPFSAVFAGGSATFTAASNPTFVTGGDTFSFIYGSPDSFNTITFSGGQSFTGSAGAFGNPGSGYFVTTVSGLGDYSSVTFSSSVNSLEFATYNVSSVPLPASLPMFGGALLALGGLAMLKKRSSKGAVTA